VRWLKLVLVVALTCVLDKVGIQITEVGRTVDDVDSELI
jgi:hypothetical protein